MKLRDKVVLVTGVSGTAGVCAEYNSYWGDRLVEKLEAADQVTWIHPEDLIPWVHSDNLGEMCVLAATHPAPVNQIYNAVDGNYSDNEFTLRIVRSMKKTLIIPDGNPLRTAYRINKIRNELEYRPIKTFEETVLQLEKQALRQSN
jgi:nucleoside-diphosphate-sugar epimerase